MLTRSFLKKNKEKMSNDLEYFDEICDDMSSSLTGLDRDVTAAIVSAEEAKRRWKGNGEGSSSYNGSEGDSDYDPERFDSQLYASMRPFSGEFLAFPQFWSMFCAYVDQTRISDVRKFQCLLDKVDEQTKAKLIGYSARNYGQAKERLMSFYLNEIVYKEKLSNESMTLVTIWIFGHLAKDCRILARKNNNGNPTFNQPRPPREIKCFKCGENGHFREQCRATIAANVVETSNVNTQLTQREQCHPIEPNLLPLEIFLRLYHTLPFQGQWDLNHFRQLRDVTMFNHVLPLQNNRNRPCQSKYIEVGTRIHCVQCELAEPFTYGTSAYVEGKKIDFLLDTGSKVNLMPLAVAERENLPISTMEQPFRCGAGGVHHSTFMYGDWNTRIGQITIMLRFFILPNYDRTILAETNIKLFRLVLEDDRKKNHLKNLSNKPKPQLASKKESSPHRSFPNSDVKMNQKLSSDIVKVRKRNQSTPLQVSKVNLYSMMLIFSLATIMSEKISIHKNEPILWKQTPYHVVEHKNYNIIRLLLVSPCENSVYRIPRNTTFTINGSNTELSLKERIIEKIHQSYSSNSKLDKLLQATEIPVYFAENHGNHTLWIILIIIIMAALVSVFIFFKFYSRSFKTETQLSSRDPRGYQTSLSSRRRNLRPEDSSKEGGCYCKQ
ncbi:hypothetical protein SSS_07020 [Sarcoptes scabiei]|uniref:CCHC-type domain-containing protein n=1 Tax=Sarcoptes scabiei TaxID=52283 RepID=A0A834R5U1_SARSC|nr:hypothetical protein SSS_07020 [Sarcoptes scabiei]